MKKKILFALGLLILVLTGVGLYYLYDNKDFYESNQTATFQIKIGETFKIKLRSNASTGFSTCWLNQTKVKTVELVDRQYKSSGPSDCDGCGGEITLTFKGVAEGKDSLKISKCPTGRMQKPCDFFNEDTLYLVGSDTVKTVPLQIKDIENIFMVVVTGGQ